MTKEFINPESLFATLQHGFSQIVTATGQKTVYISGQTAWNHKKQIVGEDLGTQAKQALSNVQSAVVAGGGTLADIVSLRIYIVNYMPDEGSVISGVLKEFFPGEQKPASTWIGVSCLASPEFMIEIEATAVVSQ